MDELYDFTAVGRYYKVYIDGEYFSQHTTEREAAQKAASLIFRNPDSEVKYIHEYEVLVALTDAGVTEVKNIGPAVDEPPTITSTPSPSFTEGTGETYDMSQHVSDDGLSPLVYSLSNPLPQGLSFNSDTGILTYDGVSGASVSSHELIATDSAGADRSDFFNIEIVALTQPDFIVAASGGDFTNFNAAVAAASPGDIIEGQAATPGGTFEDTVALLANNSGTSGNNIVIRGRAGDTIKISGVGGSGGNAYNARLNGDYLEFGQHILCEGTGSPDQSNVGRSVFVAGDNNIVWANCTRANVHAVWIDGGSNTVVRGGYQYIIGTLEKDNGTDGGDGIENQTTGNLTVYERVGACGGHGLMGVQNTGDVWASRLRAENLWDQEDDRLHPGVTTDGNRVMTWAESFDNGVLSHSVLGPIGQPYDTDAVQIARLAGKDIRANYCLLIGNASGGMGINANLPNGELYGASGLYLNYLTITQIDGAAISFSGGGEATVTNYENVNIANCLFWDLRRNPETGKDNNDLYFETASGNGRTFENIFTIRNCAFPVGARIRVADLNSGTTDYTVAQLNALPNCSGNIEITDPLFFDNTVPRVPRPVPEFDISMIADPYAAFRPTNTAVLGVGTSLTTTASAVNDSVAVPVADSGWFQAGDFSGLILGDDIYIEGFGTTRITGIVGSTLLVADSVTCANGAAVYMGTSDSPNIGWYQQAGLYS